MNMQRIISIIIIWSMLVSNIAFAQQQENINAQEMLAPTVHMDASLFQQKFIQVSEMSDLASDKMDIAKQILRLIAASDDLRNNSTMQDFLREIITASEQFKQASAQMALSERGGKKKDVDKAIYSGVEYWKKSVKSLERIDIAVIDNVIPQSHKQIIYFYLRFKAEILFNIVEADRKIENNHYAKMEYYSQIRELLEKAIALPGDFIDFQGMSFLANSCANLSTDPRRPMESQLELCEEAVLYFEEAIKLQSYSGKYNGISKITDQVYYSYFSSLYFAGDICREMKDYTKAIKFYEKVIPLCPRLRVYEVALSAIRKAYDNYYRTLLTMSKEFEANMNKDSVEDKAKLEELLNRTISVANESMGYFQADELTQGKNLGAMSCIFSAQEKRVRESLRARDWAEVSSRLLPLILQLEQMNKIICQDQHNNYAIANMNIELIELAHDIIHEFMKINSFSESSIAEMVKIFDGDFLAGFIEKVKSREYNDVLKKIKKKNTLNDAALWRALISGSAIYNKTRGYLEKSLIPNNVRTMSREEENTRIENNKKFRQDFACSARMLLAFIYLQKDSNRQAIAQIRDAANTFKEDFLKDTFLVKYILVQAFLAQEKGKDFITDLLLSLEWRIVSANFAQHRELMSPEVVIMLKDIINKNPKIKENNGELAAVLGIVAAEPKAAEPAVKNNPFDGKEVIRSFEVMRRAVNEALSLIDSQSGNNKSRSKKNKGKQAPLHVKASPVRQFENALKEMIAADKKRGVKPVFGYLRDQIIGEPVFKNRFTMGALVWTIAHMDTDQSLEIFKAYTKSFKADSLPGQEIAKALGAVNSFEVYKKQITALEKRIAESPRLVLRGSVYTGINPEQFNQNLDNFEKRAEDLRKTFFEEFSGYFLGEDMFVSQKNYKQSQEEWAVQQIEKISALLAELRSQTVSIEQDRIKVKVEEFLADVKKFDYTLYEAQAKAAAEAKEKSPAEGILLLRQWDKDLAMLPLADDISGFSEIQEALSNTNYKWATYSQEMKRQEEKISFVFGNRISFIISDDLSKISFTNEALTQQDMRNENDIINAMCEAVEALLARNPDIDIKTAVRGQDNPSPNSKVFFLPLIIKVKTRMIEVQKNKYKVKQIIAEVNQFFEKYEADVKRIIESDMPRIEKIRQLDILLDDAYNETVPDMLLENPDLIVGDFDDQCEERYNEIDDQRLALQIGNGALQVEVIGEYERLKFVLFKNINLDSVKAEIREIWQGALAYNMDIEMEVREGVDHEAPWVVDIADIWDQEYNAVFKAKKNADIMNQPVEVDSRLHTENSLAVSQAI